MVQVQGIQKSKGTERGQANREHSHNPQFHWLFAPSISWAAAQAAASCHYTKTHRERILFFAEGRAVSCQVSENSLLLAERRRAVEGFDVALDLIPSGARDAYAIQSSSCFHKFIVGGECHAVRKLGPVVRLVIPIRMNVARLRLESSVRIGVLQRVEIPPQ